MQSSTNSPLSSFWIYELLAMSLRVNPDPAKSDCFIYYCRAPDRRRRLKCKINMEELHLQAAIFLHQLSDVTPASPLHHSTCQYHLIKQITLSKH